LVEPEKRNRVSSTKKGHWRNNNPVIAKNKSHEAVKLGYNLERAILLG
jgi:hypothetical protein